MHRFHSVAMDGLLFALAADMIAAYIGSRKYRFCRPIHRRKELRHEVTRLFSLSQVKNSFLESAV